MRCQGEGIATGANFQLCNNLPVSRSWMLTTTPPRVSCSVTGSPSPVPSVPEMVSSRRRRTGLASTTACPSGRKRGSWRSPATSFASSPCAPSLRRVRVVFPNSRLAGRGVPCGHCRSHCRVSDAVVGCVVGWLVVLAPSTSVRLCRRNNLDVLVSPRPPQSCCSRTCRWLSAGVPAPGWVTCTSVAARRCFCGESLRQAKASCTW